MFYRIVFLIEIPILNELTLSVALYLTFDALVFFIQT